MEKDDEVKGENNSYDFGARIYDNRLGRWLSVDPELKSYASLSPYNFVSNTPLTFVDPDGEKIKISIWMKVVYWKAYRATKDLIKSDEGKESLRQFASKSQARRWWGEKGEGIHSDQTTIRFRMTDVQYDPASYESDNSDPDGINETSFKVDGKWVSDVSLQDDKAALTKINSETKVKIRISLNSIMRRPDEEGELKTRATKNYEYSATVAHEVFLHTIPTLKFISDLGSLSPEKRQERLRNEGSGSLQHGLFAMSGNVLLESYINCLMERRSPKFAKGLQTEINYDKNSNKGLINETQNKIDAGKLDKSKM